MAHYSILSKNEILEILKPYSIFNIKKFQILEGGSENTNYKIDSEVGKIVLTISEQKTIQEANDLAELLDHLKKNNFDTSELVHTHKNKSLTIYKNKPVMVKRYLEGKIMSDIPLHLLKQIGEDTARLHKISVPNYVRDIMWCGKERFNEVEEYALNSLFDLWLKDMHSYIDKNIASDLPKAFIHTDISLIMTRQKLQLWILKKQLIIIGCLILLYYLLVYVLNRETLILQELPLF